MVYLSSIYTKSGDQGETGLGDGSRVAKDHPRVAAYGAADELNAVLGLVLAHGFEGRGSEAVAMSLQEIQNDLFDLGADLCLPEAEDKSSPPLRVQPNQVERLEQLIDEWNAQLEPLKSFILPGGSVAAAWCHYARVVCRRAERDVVTLSREETINPQVLIYLNRLSDLLFVLARRCNADGSADVLWSPGKTRESK